jgi:hypothetical protein
MIVVSTLLVYERWIWKLISVMLLLATCFRALIIVFITQIDTDWCLGPCYAYLGLDAWLSVADLCLALCFGPLLRLFSKSWENKNFTGDKQLMKKNRDNLNLFG